MEAALTRFSQSDRTAVYVFLTAVLRFSATEGAANRETENTAVSPPRAMCVFGGGGVQRQLSRV